MLNNEINLTDQTLNTDLLELQKKFFQELNSKGRSLNTVKNYKTDLECFNQYLKENQKNINIDKFDIPQIQEYGHYLQARYTSDNSRRRRVQALRIFFDFLVAEKVFNSNPVRKIPTSPKFLDIPRPTNFVDVKTLWQYLLKESQGKSPMPRLLAKRNMLIILFVYGSGLKVSDLSRLKKEQILISNDPADDKKMEVRVLVTPDKRDPYTIPLPFIFNTVYQDYLKELEGEKKRSQVEFPYVLFNANPYRILSGGLSARGIEIVFEDIRNKLMIHLTPKSLRQSCIFKWLKQQVSEGLIKEWMGVAPSYNLKLYKDHLTSHLHDDLFLKELYEHYLKKDYSKN